MAHKFKVGDLVTVVQRETVWYTYLDDLRKQLLGKTGRIVKCDSLTFTKDDMQWYVQPEQKAGLTIYDYIVIFPAEPERRICISEVHLELFKL